MPEVSPPGVTSVRVELSRGNSTTVPGNAPEPITWPKYPDEVDPGDDEEEDDDDDEDDEDEEDDEDDEDEDEDEDEDDEPLPKVVVVGTWARWTGTATAGVDVNGRARIIST